MVSKLRIIWKRTRMLWTIGLMMNEQINQTPIGSATSSFARQETLRPPDPPLLPLTHFAFLHYRHRSTTRHVLRQCRGCGAIWIIKVQSSASLQQLISCSSAHSCLGVAPQPASRPALPTASRRRCWCSPLHHQSAGSVLRHSWSAYSLCRTNCSFANLGRSRDSPDGSLASTAQLSE